MDTGQPVVVVLTEDGMYKCQQCRAASFDKRTMTSLRCTEGRMHEIERMEALIPLPEDDWHVGHNDAGILFPKIGELWLETPTDTVWVWFDFGEQGMDWCNAASGERRGGQQTLSVREYAPSVERRIRETSVSTERWTTAASAQDCRRQIETDLYTGMMRGIERDHRVTVERPEITWTHDESIESQMCRLTVSTVKIPERLRSRVFRTETMLAAGGGPYGRP